MSKRILAVTLSVTILVFSSMTAYADNPVNKKSKVNTPYFELAKDIDNSKTFEQDQVIYGKAKQGTNVSMSLYFFKPEESQSIISNKTKDEETEGEWVLMSTEEWTVGASEVFAKSVALEFGKNKLCFEINDSDGKKTSKEVIIELINKGEVKQTISDIILKDIEKDISN